MVVQTSWLLSWLCSSPCVLMDQCHWEWWQLWQRNNLWKAGKKLQLDHGRRMKVHENGEMEPKKNQKKIS